MRTSVFDFSDNSIDRLRSLNDATVVTKNFHRYRIEFFISPNLRSYAYHHLWNALNKPPVVSFSLNRISPHRSLQQRKNNYAPRSTFAVCKSLFLDDFVGVPLRGILRLIDEAPGRTKRKEENDEEGRR